MKKKDFADILWKYFELHSNQRIQMMNFYLVAISLFFTGLITLMSSEKDMEVYEIGICIAIIFVTWIFYNLDKRTKLMIKRCEDSIKSLEAEKMKKFGSKIMIFTIDEEKKEIERELSYSDLFLLLYLFIVVLAVLGLIVIMIM